MSPHPCLIPQGNLGDYMPGCHYPLAPNLHSFIPPTLLTFPPRAPHPLAPVSQSFHHTQLKHTSEISLAYPSTCKHLGNANNSLRYVLCRP